MRDSTPTVDETVAECLAARDRAPLLRFTTCGSVDDGKSTLIGRLLYDAGALFDDQLAALEADSKRHGTQGDNLDFALLVDGLSAEREQGITIDVAHRYFSTSRRSFIVADAPGHEQYTRNMFTAASTADAAVLLVDARKGIVAQTRRHAFLASLVGIPHVALAVNKLDLVGYSRDSFDAIAGEFREFCQGLGFQAAACMPVCALNGDNVAKRSVNMRWYAGPTLVEWLEAIDNASPSDERPLRMPVQCVSRPSPEFRGYCGRLAGGTVRTGDRVRILPSGRESAVARIVGPQGDIDVAVDGQSITVTLVDEVDVSRGDVICAADAPAGAADQFEAHVVWLGDEAMLPGRPYLLKAGAKTVGVTIAAPKFRISVDTLEHLAATTLSLNDVGVCNLNVSERIAFDPYRVNRSTGSFILVDRASNATVGAGMLHFALRRGANLQPHTFDIGKRANAEAKQQRPAVLWFTGLSGAGKSTIANLVQRRLHAMGRHTYVLDGDNVRLGLCKDLGFTPAARVENTRRVAEVARLMVDAGLIVLVALISPYRAERAMARAMVEADEFCEVFVDTPLEVAESRDPKGLYRKARAGELANFTGVDAAYEMPESPDLRIDTTRVSVEAAADRVITWLHRGGRL